MSDTPLIKKLSLVGMIIGGFFLVCANIGAVEIASGSSVTLSVTASGSQPFSYQWRKDGVNLSGATAVTYKISNVQIADAGNYSAVVSNTAGSTTSNTATLTVQAAGPTPVLTIQTSSQIATNGHAVSFAAAGAPTGQWQVSTDNGSTWSDVPAAGAYRGVTTPTLEITGVAPALNNNRYRFVASGGISNAVLLTVAPAFFPFPVGISADSAGNLYVSDTANDTIQQISPGGGVNLLAGFSGQVGTANGAGASARFNDPTGVAAAAKGLLSVADNANGTIRQITSTGVVSTLAGSTTNRGNADGAGAAATFSSPLGLALDGHDNLYVADALNNTIRKISPGGEVTTLAGRAGASGSADGTGDAARFNHPTGIAVDGAGNVYVADSTNNTIRTITPAGTVTTLAGLPGVSGAQDGPGSGALFNNPGGVAVAASGVVYVADTGNSTIRKITPAGAVTTIAGLPGIAGLMDGPGGAAWFNQPQGLVLDAAGNLYVTDTGNAAIRKINPAGLVLTLALSTGLSVVESTGAPATPPSNPVVSLPPAAAASGGGGGGAFSPWLFVALGLTCLLRRLVTQR